MRTIRTVREMREITAAARRAGRSIGLVPTMGALHEGHLSLLRRAAAECDEVVLSIFVNPTQFNDPQDLAKYPRTEEADAALAAGAGADVLFAPHVEEVYPPGFATEVRVGGPLTETLEGDHRGPGHFHGVATVVTKLLNMVGPEVAYFGQKDAQQALVVKHFVRDLNLPVRIEVCPTVREPDGLAMSSRNVRLEKTDRQRAAALNAALEEARRSAAEGERDAARIRGRALSVLSEFAVDPEYLAVVDPCTLTVLDRLDGEALVAVAAQVGPVRLIDNQLIAPPA